MGLCKEAFFYFKEQGRRIESGTLPPLQKQVGLGGPQGTG
jgi:hypothetical protein